MSRYFQSTYRGSNDYRKYKHEKQGINAHIYNPNDKPQSSLNSLRSQYSHLPNNPKEHLQTFGKDQSYRPKITSQATKCSEHSWKSSSKTTIPENFKAPSLQRPLGTTFSRQSHTIKNDKSLTKNTDRFQPKLNSGYSLQQYNYGEIKGDVKMTSRQTYRTYIQRPCTKESQNRFNQFQAARIPDNLEDQILCRRKNYSNTDRQDQLQAANPLRVFNYTKKLGSSFRQNSKQQDTPHYESHSFADNQPYNIRQSSHNQMDKDKSNQSLDMTPYRNRNQMIRQRLSIKQEYNCKSKIGKTNLRSKNQTNIYEPSNLQYETKFRSAQVTPEKINLTVRQDRNVSEHRRQSLIEKSQMLKQKLNRLSTSNNKSVQNQQNVNPPKGKYQKTSQGQNYTPKRYTFGSFQPSYQQSQKIDSSITRKLKFDNNGKQTLSQKQNYESKVAKTSTDQRQSGYKRVVASNPFDYSNNKGVEDPLKKISQLNDKINIRLESILRNYG